MSLTGKLDIHFDAVLSHRHIRHYTPISLVAWTRGFCHTNFLSAALSGLKIVRSMAMEISISVRGWLRIIPDTTKLSDHSDPQYEGLTPR
jgi:hypothetical protein